MSCQEKFTFTWKIENFSMLPHQNGNYLQSSFFDVPLFNETDWFLKLYPRGSSKDKENFMAVFIARKNTNGKTIPIELSIKIKSVRRDLNKRYLSQPTEMKNLSYGFSDIISMKSLCQDKLLYLPNDILTIKYKLWFPENEETLPELQENFELEPSSLINEYTSMTRIQVNQKCVTWPITKINAFLENNRKFSFSVNSYSELSPSFKLSFSKDEKSEHAQIKIIQTKSFLKKKSVFVKCKIKIMTAREEYQHSREDSFLFRSGVEEVWNFPEFIILANLVNDKYLYLEDTLFLSFEFSYTFEGDWVSHVEIPRYMKEAFKLPKSSEVNPLCKKIQELYLDKRFCDVALKVGFETFSAQKVILCAQSPVFCDMFENEMKEKITNIIEIDDVDGGTIELMLEYLHSGVLEDGLSTDEVYKLYAAADKYQISLLKQQCTLLILSELRMENVCDILNFADSHQDDFLMTHVIDFLKNVATECFHLPEWERGLDENPALYGKVMLKVLKNS